MGCRTHTSDIFLCARRSSSRATRGGGAGCVWVGGGVGSIIRINLCVCFGCTREAQLRAHTHWIAAVLVVGPCGVCRARVDPALTIALRQVLLPERCARGPRVRGAARRDASVRSHTLICASALCVCTHIGPVELEQRVGTGAWRGEMAERMTRADLRTSARSQQWRSAVRSGFSC